MMTIGHYRTAIANLAFADAKAMTGPGRSLILAPHPDDETLGCGGLIATLCAAGTPPLVVILTDGAASHPHTAAFPADRLVHLRQEETRRATGLLGLPPHALRFLGHSDAGLIADAGTVAEIIALIREAGCTAVFAPDQHDPHCDHDAAARLARNAANACEVRLWQYPVWTWVRDTSDIAQVDHVSGWRLAIDRYLGVKQQAIAAHRSQYGGNVAGLPAGFRLPPALLAPFARPFEVFVSP